MRFMGTICHKTNISPKHLIYVNGTFRNAIQLKPFISQTQ